MDVSDALLSASFGELQDVSFPSDTLAYWLGATPTPLTNEQCDALASLMSQQYDREEQAEAWGSAVDETLTEFIPYLPVQLTQAWSPLRAAIAVLGRPDAAATNAQFGGRYVCLAWKSVEALDEASARPSVATGGGCERRFDDVLRIACGRARARGFGLALVVKPGWSFDRVREPSQHAVALMHAAGFITTVRRHIDHELTT